MATVQESTVVGAPVMDLWCYMCETKTRFIKDESAGYYKCAACDYGVIGIMEVGRAIRDHQRFNTKSQP